MRLVIIQSEAGPANLRPGPPSGAEVSDKAVQLQNACSSISLIDSPITTYVKCKEIKNYGMIYPLPRMDQSKKDHIHYLEDGIL